MYTPHNRIILYYIVRPEINNIEDYSVTITVSIHHYYSKISFHVAPPAFARRASRLNSGH